jgi:hypothetical protein
MRVARGKRERCRLAHSRKAVLGKLEAGATSAIACPGSLDNLAWPGRWLLERFSDIARVAEFLQVRDARFSGTTHVRESVEYETRRMVPQAPPGALVPVIMRQRSVEGWANTNEGVAMRWAGVASGIVVVLLSATAQARPVTIDRGHILESVSCPSTTECVAIDRQGREVTFNPQSSRHRSAQAVVATGHRPHASGPPLPLVCPSTSQCTIGAGLTFDPQLPLNVVSVPGGNFRAQP